VYAINPLAVARYRERHTVARAKSDHADAMTLANILRVDADHHRPLPQDSELVQAIAVLARAQQGAVWSRQQLANQLRSLLREYFPAALTAFPVKNIGLISREARAVLQAAPTPTAAAKLTARTLHALLRASGRQRNIATWAERLQALFAEEHPRQLPLVEEALGRQAQALLLQLDRFRFADARALKAYAGAAPITRASGKSLVVHHRKVKNQRLAAAGYVWAFASLRAPGPRAHYDRRRDGGEQHSSALRNTFNRLLGCLHHCLQKGVTYNEDVAFQPRSKAMT
jgi:transposase